LNGGGLQVDSKEAQGLFNKTAMAEGVSSNLGRRIWIEWFGPNLVRTVRSARRGSGRSDLDQTGLIWLGSQGRRGGRRNLTPTAARGSSSLELLKSDAPRVKTTRARVWDGLSDMGNPPRVTAGLGEVSVGAHDGGGGSARRRITGARVPATRASLGPRHLAQDDQEDDVVLTEGLRWVEVRRRVTVDNGRRWRRVGLHGKVDAKALWASGHRGSTRGDPAKVLWGLGRSGDHRRRGIARAEQDTGGGPGLDSGAGRARGREWKPRGASWRDGEAAASLGRS
jgi:hypothetical protein